MSSYLRLAAWGGVRRVGGVLEFTAIYIYCYGKVYIATYIC